LRAHLDALGQEREDWLAQLSGQIQKARESGAAVTAELDKQIAELYQRREREAAETATAIARLEQQQSDVRQQEARARQGIAAVIQALTGLLGFLGAAQPSDKG
jgi:chromosome segregation ATPase